MERATNSPDGAPKFPAKGGTADWIYPKADYPRDKNIQELFQARAQSTPEATAVWFQDQQLSYRELNERANQLAHQLRIRGVGLETPVGVYIDRSLNYVVGVLGILKSGGAYVPLAADYPVDRLQFILKDADVAAVLIDRPLPKDLPLANIPAVDLVQDAPMIRACPKHDLEATGNAESLAYIIYTSGSTGQPKGVAIPHRGVVRLVCGQHYAPFAPRQRFLLLASTSFDASTFELWGPLLNGGGCVVFPSQPLDFQKLEIVIRQHGVTCVWLTAGLFNQIIDARPSVLATVSHVLAGGEALSVPHVHKALDQLPQLQLTNGYGPTESTTFACTYAIPRETPIRGNSVPIGRPIANTRCYLLDEQLRLVPVGVAGELHIGGDGLARGYHNRPALTAEKFIADPHSAEPGARLYKTGDLARYLPDGNIEFLGRIDQQVKIRGFRIEPGEIEAALARHPQVLKVAVIAREDIPGHKQLAAYLVITQTSGPTVSDLRTFLQQTLPAYMIPAAFTILADLPLTSNGKVDRNALLALPCPLPVETPFSPQSSEAVAGTALEQGIARIWHQVLQQPAAGLDCNFFEAGGDSLRIASVHVHLQQLIGREFPITDLFAHTTIRSLAKHFQSGELVVHPPSVNRSRAQKQRQALTSHGRGQRA